MTTYENTAFEVEDIIKMKRLCSFIAIKINRLESSRISDWTEYYKLKQAYNCYKEYV